MILTQISIVPLPGKREAVLDILQNVEVLVRGRAGCEACAVYEEAGGDGRILYLDQWRSFGELDRHIQSPLFLRVLLAMELASQLPEVHFFEIAKTMDMSWVANLRSAAHCPAGNQPAGQDRALQSPTAVSRRQDRREKIDTE